MHIAVVGHVFNSISIIPNPESFSFQSLIMVQRITDNGEGVLFSTQVRYGRTKKIQIVLNFSTAVLEGGS